MRQARASGVLGFLLGIPSFIFYVAYVQEHHIFSITAPYCSFICFGMCENNVSACFIQKRMKVNEMMDEYVVNGPDEGNVSNDPEENAGVRERNKRERPRTRSYYMCTNLL